MTLLQPKRQQRLLRSPAWLLVLAATEKEKHVLEITYSAGSVDLSEEAKRAMEGLSEAMSSAC